MIKRKRRRSMGGRLLFWGALSLLALTGYEFWARLEVVWWALKGLYNLCVSEGIPIRRALTHFDPSMFYLIAFLGACVVYGVMVFALRNRPAAGYFLLLGVCAIGVAGGVWFNVFGLSVLNILQSVKLVPLLAIAVGSVLNIAQYHAGRGKRGRWESVYEEEGITERGPRGKDVRREVDRSRRDKRYRDAGLYG